jgi:hypothetical protein
VLGVEVLQADAGAARQAVAGRHHQHQVVLVHRDAVDVGVVQRADQAEVHVLGQDHRQDLLGVPGPDRQPHPRGERPEAA